MTEDRDSPALAQGLTQIQRLTAIIFDPAAVFTDILRNRSWWLPFLVLALASYAFSGAMLRVVGLERLTYQALHQNSESSERLANATPEVQAKTYDYTRTSLEVTFAATPLLLLGSVAVTAVVLWPTLILFFGGRTTFSNLLPVVMYASLISVLKVSLACLLLFVSNAAETFHLDNPLGTNLGFYLEPDAPAWLKSAAGSLDIVTIWYLVVLSIGCSIVAKVSRGAAAAAVFGWWILIIIISAGWAMLN